MWKKSGEFENLRTLGETFLSACDVDKEIVKQELAAVKARWDKLNNGRYFGMVHSFWNLEEIGKLRSLEKVRTH